MLNSASVFACIGSALPNKRNLPTAFINTGGNGATKGEPGTSVNAPVNWSMRNPEIAPAVELATYKNCCDEVPVGDGVGVGGVGFGDGVVVLGGGEPVMTPEPPVGLGIAVL